jgi:hypothetical protein
MPEYNDVYALVPGRDGQTIARFLDLFLPHREEAAESYPVPMAAAEARQVFRRVYELVDYLVVHPREAYSVYWSSLGGTLAAHAMAFFTGDGGLILGVSIPASTPPADRDAERIANCLDVFARQLGALNAYALYETPPSYDTAGDFLKDLPTALPPKLVAGTIIPHSPEQPYRGPVFLR